MNCAVGPRNALETVRRMRDALESAGLQRPLILQPNGLKTPDDGTPATALPGWPLGEVTRDLRAFVSKKENVLHPTRVFLNVPKIAFSYPGSG